MRTSIRSFAIGLIGLGATAVVRTLVVLGLGGKNGAMLVSDVGTVAVVLAAAVVILLAARRLPRDELRRSWLLLGAGVGCFALGDITWAVMELGNLGAPYPGPPDIFYLMHYVFVGAAVFIPAIKMRRREEVAGAVLVAGLSGVVVVACLFFWLIEPILLKAGQAPAELVLNVVYPLADVCLLAMPAVFVLVIAMRTGDRDRTLPWLYVSTGLIIMAATDTVFSWMSAVDVYVPGAVVDYGWMIATVALAVGASLALDAATAAQRQTEEGPSAAVVPTNAYSVSAREVDEH